MKIEYDCFRKLRQRHWMAVGLVVGLIAASVVVLLPGLFAHQIMPEEFERAVTAQSIDGNPVARNVTVHVRSGYSYVTLDLLQPQPSATAGSDAAVYQYVSVRFDPKSPYVPKMAPLEVVDLRINPGPAAMGVGAEEDSSGGSPPVSLNGSSLQRWSSHLRLSDWTPHDNGASAGPADGAELDIGMRYGDYRLLIQADTSQAEMNLADHLAIRLNDKPLPPLIRTDEVGVWQTRVSKDQFKLNERQVVQFLVKKGSIRIRQIRLEDPNYTILNYLAYVKGRYQGFDYDIGWWDNPAIAFPLFGGLGLFIIGIVLPIALRVIIRTRELMMLAKAKRMSAMSNLVPGSPDLTIEDWFQLMDLIGALETSLREVLVGQSATVAAGAAAAPESHPADTFIQRVQEESVAVVDEDPDKAFGCKKDDVYPTELGAAVGKVLFTSEDTRELNDIYGLRHKEKAGSASNSHQK